MTIELMCLPPSIVVAYLWSTEQVHFEAYEHYQKRSFRNRVYIAGPNGRQLLTVPLASGKNQAQVITDVAISYDEDWPTQWLMQLHNAYSNAPYFIYYIEELTTILSAGHQLLWTLNKALMDWLIKVTDITIHPKPTDEYHKVYANNEDYRSTFLPDTRFWRQSCPRYGQVYEAKHGFIGHLSILDLIMCRGPESKIYLRHILEK